MKKALTLLLAGVVCLSAAGCGSFLDGEYVVTENYKDELPVVNGSSVIVNNAQSLRNAILALVDAHQSEEILTFTGYDGDVSVDLPRICSELKSENALCSYAVDYFSYDLSRIVSYYEAHIYVNYLRTAEEIAALQNIGSVVNAEATLRRAVSTEQSPIVFSAIGSVLTDADVQAMVEAYYCSAPLDCLNPPRAELSVYPNVGVSRIYEVIVDYGGEADERIQKLDALRSSAAELAAAAKSSSDAESIENAAHLLSSHCEWTDTSAGSDITAYGALVEGHASSAGCAMAYKALCDILEIECYVVNGSIDKTPHVWNIVRLGENYYHVDVSQLISGAGSAVILSDSEMRSSYWWNIDQYPAASDLPIYSPADAEGEVIVDEESPESDNAD